ncbi:dienelactone hydrolase family protein [Bradyrhizobium sp. ISRA464]|nr:MULTISPECIES: dienelactone hydrolase family protein [unclassified Bradyrhizobium]WGS23251.1 dienelactone hydrolase family protein [Bradyrhizobium sp. ISRA463]WGS30260.1 dienelactone hydrolase family protein [Bradyrhizobium sp. ISRA464]
MGTLHQPFSFRSPHAAGGIVLALATRRNYVQGRSSPEGHSPRNGHRLPWSARRSAKPAPAAEPDAAHAQDEGAVLGPYGKADTGIPVSSVDAFKQAHAANNTAEFKIHPGARHGFHADHPTAIARKRSRTPGTRCSHG